MTYSRPLSVRTIAHKAELYVAGLFFLIMLAVVIANVFLRYFFRGGLLFTEELAYIGFTWSVFAAVAWLYRTRMLISVDIFFGLLPPRLQRGLSILVNLTLFGANLWFCWLSWTLAAGGFVRKTPVLEVPYFWINLAPMVSFGLMAIYSMAHLIRDLKGGRYGANAQEPAELSEGSSL
ncbi:TRAP transporter small permease [Paracoccus saliphilus]|uniref:TRAP transporter small permease protein n=1 Tax=Paracoccus saliphilus TaxID=405559 RepID=A0AA46A4S5_9RHOB|nr:TRAP transporter small permease [Paracoccus saliphilus]WCR01471.1 TRAP transporter small permease [Paracoccus saliphilus]SIS69039.1 TRAP-type C4-dicarboxylate transport system, small permease component [Paracoccus saliphilus]